MKKIAILLVLFGVFGSSLPVAASLYDYYASKGLKLPPISERAVLAVDCGIVSSPSAYKGNLEQNKALENCLNGIGVDYWVYRIKHNDENPLTDEEFKKIPEEAWYEVTPQLIQFLPPPGDQGEPLLGAGGEPIVTRSLVCHGKECDKYVTRNQQKVVGFSVVSRYQTTLSSGMTSTQTTVPVASITTFDGTTLTMALLGSKIFLTVEPGSVREEITKCTSITSSQWSGCTRGLAFSGTSEAAVSANQKAHNAGSIVVMSNVHYVYDQLVDIETEHEFVTGTKWFTSNGIVFGDGATVETKRLYFCDSNVTTTCGFIYAAPSSTAAGSLDFGWSVDGSTTQLFNSAGTVNSAGKGISISSGVIAFSPGASSTGIGFNNLSQPTVATSSGGGISSYGDGLRISTSTNFTWSGTHAFSASTTFSTATTSIKGLAVTSPNVAIRGLGYTFPSTQGASSTVLKNDGAGALIWDPMDWQLFFTTTTDSASSSLSVTNIPASCKLMTAYLYIHSISGGGNQVGLTFNNDNATNYRYRFYENYTIIDSSVSKAFIGLSGTSTAHHYIFDIVNNPSNNKQVHVRGGSAGADNNILSGTGTWINSSDAISSMRFYSNNVSVDLGGSSRLKVYCSKD